MGAPRPEALASNPQHRLKTIAESLSLHVLKVDCPTWSAALWHETGTTISTGSPLR